MIFQFSDKNPSMPVAYSYLDAMHTRFEIIVAGLADKDEVKDFISSLWTQVENDDRRLNRFSSGSEIYRINSRAYANAEKLDDELFMILKMCQVFKNSTFGYFDITANLMSRGNSEGPCFALDDKEHTIRFLKEETRIDLGGFAKGYTLDKIVKSIRAKNIKYALINAGDSSSYGIGTHPFGNYWPIGVEHPFFKGKSIHEFHLMDNSLSISGKNRQGAPHIIDPSTGNTISREELIAVTGSSPLVTEILSTALYVAPEKIRKDIIKQFPEYMASCITPLCNGEKTLTQI